STRLLIAAYTGPLRPLATFGSRLLRGSGLARLLARITPRRLASARFGLAMLASSSPSPRLLSQRVGPAGSPEFAAPARDSSGSGAPHTPPYGQGATQVGSAQSTARVGSAEDIAPDGERAFAEPHGLMGAYPEAPAVTDGPGEAEGTLATMPLRVGVLIGCVQESLFARVNRATARVLEANGCKVVPVAAQVCCGALDAHAGRLERARSLARENIAAFERADVDVIVVNAAGCGAMMKEYDEQLRHDEEWKDRAEAFVARVRDL